MNRRVVWVLLALVVVGAFVIAFAGNGASHPSAAKQADTIARAVRCPTCRGQSVAESAAPAAQAIRTEIRRRIDAGESRREIEAYLEDRYGSDILLTPPGNGVGGLVWVIPVVVIVGAGAGLGVALQRWSRRSLEHATEADRLLVARGGGTRVNDAADRSALEAERDFLLRSIADLDAEEVAGDLDHEDHDALRDDYVARAAAVLRALDDRDDTARRGASEARGPHEEGGGRGGGAPSGKKISLTIAACLAAAVLAGVFLAHSVGSRPAGAPLSGSLPSTTSDQLERAAQFIADGKAVDAIKLYDKVLKDDPKQPVALAYRGWLIRLAGLKDEGFGYAERAVAADPSYPDAHFFLGMMLWQDKSDPASAVGEFRLFLANRPPQAMVPLVEDALRRASQDAGIPTDATTTTAR